MVRFRACIASRYCWCRSGVHPFLSSLRACFALWCVSLVCLFHHGGWDLWLGGRYGTVSSAIRASLAIIDSVRVSISSLVVGRVGAVPKASLARASISSALASDQILLAWSWAPWGVGPACRSTPWGRWSEPVITSGGVAILGRRVCVAQIRSIVKGRWLSLPIRVGMPGGVTSPSLSLPVSRRRSSLSPEVRCSLSHMGWCRLKSPTRIVASSALSWGTVRHMSASVPEPGGR